MATATNLRLDDQLCFALYAATNTVVRAYRPLLDRIGLTYPQYLVMLVLWQGDDLAVSEIAQQLVLPPHGLSPLLDRLTGAGLVTRTRDAADHRVVRVKLTAAGRDLECAAVPVQTAVVCQTTLSDDALADLREQLHDLVRGMRGDLEFPTRSAVVADRSSGSPQGE